MGLLLKKLLSKFILNCIPVALLVLWSGKHPSPDVWVLFALGILIVSTFQLALDARKEQEQIISTMNSEFKKKYEEINSRCKKDIENEMNMRLNAQQSEMLWKKCLIEKTSGFGSLHEAIQTYEEMADKGVANYLLTKKHPSAKGAEVVREEANRRRHAELVLRKTQAIIEYYESIAPFLLDFKNEVIGIDDDFKYQDYSEEEKQDPAISFLSKEEFRKLPSIEKNQKALDRYWDRPKSKWLIGRIYERYVGYLYESNGYDVEYVGIFKGYEDLGRDLICKKGHSTVIVQCKYWSQFKTIYEKHIFQFFGTVFQYKDSLIEKNSLFETGSKNVSAVFYTSTQLSELASRFAKELGIELKEKFPFDKNYACIKCNISRVNGEKIYHLPFDQQYDNVKIEKNKGEFYCSTVKEAEEKGFRRAFRYGGSKTAT